MFTRVKTSEFVEVVLLNIDVLKMHAAFMLTTRCRGLVLSDACGSIICCNMILELMYYNMFIIMINIIL